MYNLILDDLFFYNHLRSKVNFMPKPPKKKPNYKKNAITAISAIGLAALGVIIFGVKTIVDDNDKVTAPETETTQTEQIPAVPETPPTEEAEVVEVAEVETLPPTAVIDDWRLILVNEQNPLPEGFEVELTEVSPGYFADKRISDSLGRMFLAAKEDGITLTICSAYRSVERQEELFDGYVEERMAQGMDETTAIAATKQYSAIPGCSEHHTGLALDIVTPDYMTLDDGYADTAAAKWLAANAGDFGFVMRYPKDKEDITMINFEPWHYRFVGYDNALAMNRENFCLEEYVASLGG
jgi:D-alanyl-D-alanine carboxypeptidase